MAERVVAVFEHSRGPGRKPLVTAYTRDYNPTWEGCCLHVVDTTAAEAKKAAIANHKARVGCRGSASPAQRSAPTPCERPEQRRGSCRKNLDVPRAEWCEPCKRAAGSAPTPEAQ